MDFSWVDPNVVEKSSNYSTVERVAEFFVKNPALKPGGHSNYFDVVPCGPTERVCMGRPGDGRPFFYMYTFFFSNLHVSLPFDTFTMGVLWALNVAPTQVHPNTWASLQAFRLLCDVMRLHPSPSCFLCYYACHPAKKASWHSLVGRTGSVLFDLFASSYKKFKERFVKVIIRPKATAIFFDESGGSRFPLYWTRMPCGFKEWPRPTEGANELEILSLFDALPRRLPCRTLIGAYAKPGRWTAVRGMGFFVIVFSRSVGRPSLLYFLTCVLFYLAETMVNERSNAVSVRDKHRQKAVERKGRRSLDVMPPNDDVTAKSKDRAGPSQKSKKRPREGSNIATTTGSPGSMPTPPPPCREVVEVVPPSSRSRPGSCDAVARSTPTPFDLLGRGHQFTRKVRVALPDESREALRDVPPTDLLRSGLELMCRSVVLMQHGLQG